ncbi:MAG: pseudouridine synthase [Acidobacteria bacterium]|nr:pseudouridine synthase [Acidobacteriota bacterium]NIM62880.1 pseudouridine synthase [Acidobacteriota bacterium]NIO58823.1 pseudouridine synthase [Acidobacteriota bacterium]NIQ29880.1 pseudouridine synthase [Acidobacteriota bacterium]NIQ84604.1 pseudouridine synthase [Acidobacteriota bacterium]
MERINKVLARAGVASRRGADTLIEEGRVTVNGEIVRELGVKIDPARDAVKVDGRRIHLTADAKLYLMLHKPDGVVTTLDDPEGRTTVRDLLRGVRGRVFPVGRLDYHSEGLLFFTNDGEWANELMHPQRKVAKVYRVKVRGTPSRATLARLSAGIRLDGRRTAPARFRLSGSGTNAWLDVTLYEGRKNQVRRMLRSVGHPVSRLRRLSIGGVELGELPPGRWRPLTGAELKRLRRAVREGADGP